MRILILISLVSLVVACGTQKNYRANDAQNLKPLEVDLVELFKPDLSKGQMYISSGLLLKPKTDSALLRIKEGTFFVSERRHQIKIPQYTGGQVTNQAPEKLRVKFREDDQHYLTFAQNEGRYYVAANWIQNSSGETTHGEIKYGDKTYLIPKSAGSIHLLIDKKYEKRIRTKVEPGVEVE